MYSQISSNSPFKWINPKYLDSNKYSRNSSIGFVSNVDVEYYKEIHELYNDYPQAKIEIR